VYPSAANFLLVRFGAVERALAACKRRGVIIRDRSQELGLAGCARISVGTAEENEQLVGALKELRP
jgi:histidinol-phosphate/aromatic aminotransferase/cobyric acid decarboxylase-like protein